MFVAGRSDHSSCCCHCRLQLCTLMPISSDKAALEQTSPVILHAVDKRRELSRPDPELVPHRAEAKHDVQVPPDLRTAYSVSSITTSKHWQLPGSTPLVAS